MKLKKKIKQTTDPVVVLKGVHSSSVATPSTTEKIKSGSLKIRSTELIKKTNDLLQIKKMHGVQRQKYLRNLVKCGWSEAEITKNLADQYNLQKIDISSFTINPEIAKMIPKRICEKFGIIPMLKIEDTVVVAFCDPGDISAKEVVSLGIRFKTQIVVAERSQIKKAINQLHDEEDSENSDVEGMEDFNIDSSSDNEKESLNIVDLSAIHSEPVTNAVNKIIIRAIRCGASDIHIEIYEKFFRIRFRLDGCLSEQGKMSMHLAPFIVNRIKILAKMDISERRLPQDGRMKVQINNRVVDLRVSSVPVVHGEKVVLRILNSEMSGEGVDKLGMLKKQEVLFKKYLHLSQGLILMTGPTGSGKTTTIYSGLSTLNKSDKNISTVEDPVEYKVQGVNQVQVHAKIGLTFSSVLRTFLRQDPDVILVGEIRDLDTAKISYRAAATGHLVLSTLHTNDTISTVTRLIDIGLPSYVVAENTSLVVAQRLIRLLCEHCKEPYRVSEQDLIQLGISPDEAPKAVPKIMDKGTGCSHCNNMGFKGRKAVFEVMEMSRSLKDGIIRNQSLKELKNIAVKKNNMITLRQSALHSLQAGQTSISEVLYGTTQDY